MDSNEYLEDEKEWADYDEMLESLLKDVDEFEQMGPVIQDAITAGRLEPQTVASLESIVPGILTDDYDVMQAGGVFTQEAYQIALEQTINTEFDFAMFLMGKFIKLNIRGAKLLAKSSARLAGVISTLVDDKVINGGAAVLGTTLRGNEKIPQVNFSKLSPHTKEKLIKLVHKYTGNTGVGEAEVIKTIEAVRSSKNGIEIMSKIYMPRYSNLLIPLFYIPGNHYRDIVKFFKVMDEVVLPKVDTNLNTAIMQLNKIMGDRDWVSLSKFETRIFTDEDKEHVYKLAKTLQITLKPTYSFKRVCAKTYANFGELVKADKKGITNDPKYHQKLTQSVKDLESIKDHVISVSDTMSDMSKHSDSRTSGMTKDLRRFRASKTVKESIKGGRNINKYSNAVYSRVMREMKEVAILSSFMSQVGRDVLTAYAGVYTRSNTINTETIKFVESLNKILGE